MKLYRWIASTLLLSVLATSSLGGESTLGWSEPVQISQGPGPAVGNLARNIGVGPDGVIHALWNRKSGQRHTDVYYARSSDGGQTWSAGRDIDQSVASSSSPVLAVGPDGTLHAVWTTGSPQSGSALVYSRSSDSGQTWSTPRSVSGDIPGDPGAQNIDVDFNSRVHLTWQVIGEGGGAGQLPPSNVFYTRSDDGGSTFAAPQQLNTVPDGAAFPRLNLKGTSGQRVAVAWRDRRADSWDIYVAVSDDGGVTFTEHIAQDNPVGEWDPDVAVDVDGIIHLAYHTQRTPLDVVVDYSRSRDGGVSWSQPVTLSEAKPSRIPSWAPDLSRGVLWLFWKDERDYSPNGTGPCTQDTDRCADVAGKYTTDGGDTWSPLELATDLGEVEAKFPAVVVDPEGRPNVLWSDMRFGAQNEQVFFTRRLSAPTVETSATEGAFPGYTLFAPLSSTTTYLIDNDGAVMHTWEGDGTPGNSVYLLEDGHLLKTASVQVRPRSPFARAAGSGGRVQEVDWDGTVLWEYEYAGETFWAHHDVARLPNGNVLMVAWEMKSAGQAIAAGRDPATLEEGGLWADHVIEVRPSGPRSGQIVWEWHAWDHLVQDFDATKDNYGPVAEHPQRIDVNFSATGRAEQDWNHINAIAYNAELDQIMLSVRNFSEVWVIDHSTTTAEAASSTGGRWGKGGDLLYRFGNPQAYGHGSAADRQLFGQHDAHWIASGLPGAGHVLLFNNGQGRPDGNYSSVEEFALPTDESGGYSLSDGGGFAPAQLIWSYIADEPSSFFAANISGAQRLPNGNTLICDGPHGVLFEVTSAGEVVWSYVNPFSVQTPQGARNEVFRAYRYAPDHPGLVGRF